MRKSYLKRYRLLSEKKGDFKEDHRFAGEGCGRSRVLTRVGWPDRSWVDGKVTSCIMCLLHLRAAHAAKV